MGGDVPSEEAGERRAPKNIVLCSDGTGNRGGKGNGTNVWKIYQAVDRTAHRTSSRKIEQRAVYDDGVGSDDSKLVKIVGGAFGWGLSRNIRDLYTYLVHNFEEGDRLYLFGFSRGAFTVRSLAGMIDTCGVFKPARGASEAEIRDGVRRAWKNYRRRRREERTFPTRLADLLRRWFLRKPAARDASGGETIAAPRRYLAESRGVPATIRFLGLWDTVDAIGGPFDELRDLLDVFLCNKFHRHDLSPSIENAYHALALDDDRMTFHPVMLDERLTAARQQQARKAARAAGEPERTLTHVEQVWFTGAHSNVGGGYPKQGLAAFSLQWMMKHASDHGLFFKTGEIARAWRACDADDRLYDPRAGVGVYYRYKPRDVTQIVAANCDHAPVIHASVYERILHGRLGYAPGNLPTSAQLDVTGTETPIGSEENRSADRVRRAVEDRGAGRSSRLETVQGSVRMRRVLHLALVAATIAIAWSLWALDESALPDTERGWIGSLFGVLGAVSPVDFLEARLEHAGVYFTRHPWRLGTVVLALGLLLALTLAARWRMRGAFATFFGGVRADAGSGPAPSSASRAPRDAARSGASSAP